MKRANDHFNNRFRPTLTFYDRLMDLGDGHFSTVLVTKLLFFSFKMVALGQTAKNRLIKLCTLFNFFLSIICNRSREGLNKPDVFFLQSTAIKGKMSNVGEWLNLKKRIEKEKKNLSTILSVQLL